MGCPRGLLAGESRSVSLRRRMLSQLSVETPTGSRVLLSWRPRVGPSLVKLASYVFMIRTDSSDQQSLQAFGCRAWGLALRVWP